MADARGRVRSEGMLSGRAAHYVCYPGETAASHIVTVKANEYDIGAACLRLCREHESDDKLVGHAACQRAQAALRAERPVEEAVQ